MEEDSLISDHCDGRLESLFRSLSSKGGDLFAELSRIVVDREQKYSKRFNDNFLRILEREVSLQNSKNIRVLVDILHDLAQFPHHRPHRGGGKSCFSRFISNGLVTKLKDLVHGTHQWKSSNALKKVLDTVKIIADYSLDGTDAVVSEYVLPLVERLSHCKIRDHLAVKKEVNVCLDILKSHHVYFDITKSVCGLASNMHDLGDVYLQKSVLELLVYFLRTKNDVKRIAKCLLNSSLAAKFFTLGTSRLESTSLNEANLMEFLLDLNRKTASRKYSVTSAKVDKVRIVTGGSKEPFNDAHVYFNYGSKSVVLYFPKRDEQHRFVIVNGSEVTDIRSRDIIDAEGKPYREVVLSSSETEQVAFLLSRNDRVGSVVEIFDNIEPSKKARKEAAVRAKSPPNKQAMALSEIHVRAKEEGQLRKREMMSAGIPAKRYAVRRTIDVPHLKDDDEDTETENSPQPSLGAQPPPPPPPPTKTPVATVRGRQQGFPSPSPLKPSVRPSLKLKKRISSCLSNEEPSDDELEDEIDAEKELPVESSIGEEYDLSLNDPIMIPASTQHSDARENVFASFLKSIKDGTFHDTYQSTSGDSGAALGFDSDVEKEHRSRKQIPEMSQSVNELCGAIEELSLRHRSVLSQLQDLECSKMGRDFLEEVIAHQKKSTEILETMADMALDGIDNELVADVLQLLYQGSTDAEA